MGCGRQRKMVARVWDGDANMKRGEGEEVVICYVSPSKPGVKSSPAEYRSHMPACFTEKGPF